MVAMTTTARRPLNWNLLTVDSRTPDKTARQLEASVRRSSGRRPDRRPDHAHPGAHEHELPHPLRPLPHPRAGATSWACRPSSGSRSCATRRCGPSSTSWPTPRTPACSAGCPTGPTTSSATPSPPRTRATAGATSAPSPRSRASRPSTPCSTWSSPTTCAPCCGPRPPTATTPRGRPGSTCGTTPGRMVGGSDAGAHLDRMCGSNYPTSFLGDCLRKRKLVPMEQAVQLMTQAPAELFGLHDRGRVAEGLRADLFVFDPETVGSEPATLVDDLPGGSPRLIADCHRCGPGPGQRGRDRRRRASPPATCPGTLLESGHGHRHRRHPSAGRRV